MNSPNYAMTLTTSPTWCQAVLVVALLSCISCITEQPQYRMPAKIKLIANHAVPCNQYFDTSDLK